MDTFPKRGILYFIVLLIMVSAFFGVGYFFAPVEDVGVLKPNLYHEPEKVKPEKDVNPAPVKETSTVVTDSTVSETTNITTSPKELRSDVVIRYYKKDADNGKVLNLSSLGFYVHERKSSSLLKDYASNVIYYGDSVRRDDIINIARFLKDQGIGIRAIQHSRYGDGWKSHSIEIGADTTLVNLPIITDEDIVKVVNENPYIKD